MTSRWSLAVVMAGLALACGGTSPGSQPGASNEEDGTSRLSIAEASVSMPTADMAAAYFVIVNSGDGDDQLVTVETENAESADLHESIDDDGVMRMLSRPDGFPIPAGATLALAPGGAHVMLVAPEPVDRAIELTLTFENHEPITIELPVETAPDPAAETDHSGHDGHDGHGP